MAQEDRVAVAPVALFRVQPGIDEADAGGVDALGKAQERGAGQVGVEREVVPPVRAAQSSTKSG